MRGRVGGAPFPAVCLCDGCAASRAPGGVLAKPRAACSNGTGIALNDVNEAEIRMFLLFRRPELRPDRNRLRPILLPLLPNLYPELPWIL